MKRLTVFVLIVLLVALVVVFFLENNQPTALQFLGWSTPQLSVAAYIITALLFGVVIGQFVTYIFYYRALRVRHRDLRSNNKT